MESTDIVAYLKYRQNVICQECWRELGAENVAKNCDSCHTRAELGNAIDAVMRRIPQKPVIDFYNRQVLCPNCDKVLFEYPQYKHDVDMNYCPQCAQVIDWSDENE